ncbi:hypothetical protein [Actinocorallia longicatena]|uniref:Caspase domain-containing protein n=1 Tax=Actinocorallia longicatena TaxID=111803 RepID=A0ABP6QFN4_9ACTN
MPSGPAEQRVDELHRLCVIAGTQTFGTGVENLDHVPDELALVRSVLRDDCGMEVHPRPGLDPTSPADFLDGLHAAIDRAPDVLVLYYTGHGFLRQDTELLLPLANGDPGRPATVLPAQALLTELQAAELGEVVVILDVCDSDAAADDLRLWEIRTGAAGRATGRVHLITAARKVEKAQQLAFARAFTAAIQSPGISPNDRYIPLKKLEAEIQHRLGDLYQNVTYHPPRGAEESRAFPNPDSGRRQTSRPLEARAETGWVFCGRDRAVEQVVAFLASTGTGGRCCAITGKSGTGKSILLKWIASASSRRPFPTSDPDAVSVVPEGCVHLRLDAHGQEGYTLLSQVARRFGVEKEPGEPGFFDELDTAHGPKAILIDSIDKAREPDEPISEVLAPLAELSSVRLVVASGAPPRGLPAEEICLDDAVHSDSAEIARLVRSVLVKHANSVHHEATENDLGEMVRWVVERSESVFRWAYRYAIDLAYQTFEEVRALMPDSITDRYAHRLRRISPEGDPHWARDLLAPLAYALGAGMPDHRLWSEVAHRLRARRASEAELEHLLSQAADYLDEASDPGPDGGWRLSSDVADYLIQDADTAAAHTAFTEAMMAALPGGETTGWFRADTYTQRNFAEHALLAGALTPFLDDPEFLLAMDAHRLRRALTLDGRDKARKVRELCESVTVHGSHTENLSQIALLAAAFRLPELADAARRRTTGWTASLADRHGSDAVDVVGPAEARRLVIGTLDGRLLASGPIGGLEPLVQGADPVSAFGTRLVHGVPYVAVGHWSGTVDIHDLVSGETSTIDDLDSRIVACDFGERGLVVATARGWRMHELGVGEGPLVPSGGHALSAVAQADVDGEWIVVGACTDRVRVWAADGTFLREFRTGQRRALTSVVVLDDSIFVASDDGTVFQSDVYGYDGHILFEEFLSAERVTTLSLIRDEGNPRLLVTGKNGTAIIATFDGRDPSHLVTMHVGLAINAAVLPNDRELVICSDVGTARLHI